MDWTEVASEDKFNDKEARTLLLDGAENVLRS